MALAQALLGYQVAVLPHRLQQWQRGGQILLLLSDILDISINVVRILEIGWHLKTLLSDFNRQNICI